MWNEDELLAAYRELEAWVHREQVRLEGEAELPSQPYLRRLRLVTDIGELEFRELLAELRDFGS